MPISGLLITRVLQSSRCDDIGYLTQPAQQLRALRIQDAPAGGFFHNDSGRSVRDIINKYPVIAILFGTRLETGCESEL